MTFTLLPYVVLAGIVAASTAQTEFAHYVAQRLRFDKPYLTFYLTHSTFMFIFPLHLIILYFTSPVPLSAYFTSIRSVLTKQLELTSSIPTTSSAYIATWAAIFNRWCWKVTMLTILVSVSALAWFVAMQYSTPVDITSIYATSSFAAYGFSLLLLREPLSKLKVVSIILAFVGVLIISSDGIEGAEEHAGRRALGDCIMLFGAILLGLYEVVYKLALPEGHGGIPISPDEDYEPLPISHTPLSSPSGNAIHYRQHVHHQRSNSTLDIQLETSSSISPDSTLRRYASTVQATIPKHEEYHAHEHTHGHPVPLPPALHANFLTSCIGLATFLFLWPPILWLHWMGYEIFQWPGGLGDDATKIWLGLGVVTWGGSIYNAGLMVLIGIWGPTPSSVVNLLVIGLVALIDAIWVGVMPDLQTFIGVGMICAGFVGVLWEGDL
nr:hypothetical protein L204_04112 [Cryptococcus depauperatus CBS 7855]